MAGRLSRSSFLVKGRMAQLSFGSLFAQLVSLANIVSTSCVPFPLLMRASSLFSWRYQRLLKDSDKSAFSSSGCFGQGAVIRDRFTIRSILTPITVPLRWLYLSSLLSAQFTILPRSFHVIFQFEGFTLASGSYCGFPCRYNTISGGKQILDSPSTAT